MLMALAIAPASAAQAVTFCAGTSAGCTQVFPATGDGVQQALTAADNNVNLDGSPNAVHIGAGTYTRTTGQGFVVNSTVVVSGQGLATVLAASPSSGGTIRDAFRSNGSPSTLQSLTIDVTGPAAAGVRGFTLVADVRVTGPGSPEFGVEMPAGSRASRLLIDPVPAPAFSGALISSGAVIEDSLIRLAGANSTGVDVEDVSGNVAPAVMRHLTIVGNGQAGSQGVSVHIPWGNPSPRVATGSVRDCVIRGVAVALHREGQGAPPPPFATGTANLQIRYSSFSSASGSILDSGPGTLTFGPGNLNDPDPRFADPASGDLSLLPDSPLINAGDPGGPEAGDSATDEAGAPRIVGGRRDIGAFEAPAPVINPPPPLDLTPPIITGAHLSRSSFQVGPVAARAVSVRPSHHPGRGSTLTYGLSEPATVNLAVQREVKGRLVKRGGHPHRVCVKATWGQGMPGKDRCTLLGSPATLAVDGTPGENSTKLSGRIGARRLRTGPYRLTLTATDPAGNRSRPVRLRFRIVG